MYYNPRRNKWKRSDFSMDVLFWLQPPPHHSTSSLFLSFSSLCVAGTASLCKLTGEGGGGRSQIVTTAKGCGLLTTTNHNFQWLLQPQSRQSDGFSLHAVLRIGSPHSLTPSPESECCLPPVWFQGGYTLACGRGDGMSEFGRRDRRSGEIFSAFLIRHF
jgi:hypothetical protein